jgi:hypothetical protein
VSPSPEFEPRLRIGATRLTDGDEDEQDEQDEQGEQDEMTDNSDVLDEHTPVDVER